MAESKQRDGSLTDKEVAITKRLLMRKTYQNQEILGFVNAMRRRNSIPDTNNGRITEVKHAVEGKYEKLTSGKAARFKSINPATDADADDFLQTAQKTQAPVVISSHDPLNEAVIKKLFSFKEGSTSTIIISETDKIECKESFDIPIKTVAAFANNKGGYFFLGVKDKTWEVIGLKDNKFEDFDLRILNQKIRSCLGADLQIQKKIIKIKSKTVGILYIAPAQIKPLIFIKEQKDGIAEGHIYYRYPGEDRLIAPADLQKVIEDRIRQLTETILMKQIGNILKMGPENAAIMNTITGEVEGKSGNFLIDESLLSKLSFVREGEFVEKHGAPALRLIGDLQKANAVVVNKEVKVPSDTLYPYKAKQVCNKVSEITGKTFSPHNHTQAFNFYKVRPKGGSKNPEKTNTDFCIYSPTFNAYIYSDKWIEKLVKIVRNDKDFKTLKEFKS